MVKSIVRAQSVRKSERPLVQTSPGHTNLQCPSSIPLSNLRKHMPVENHQCHSRSPLQLCRPFLMKRGASRSSRLRVARLLQGHENRHPILILSLRVRLSKMRILVSPLNLPRSATPHLPCLPKMARRCCILVSTHSFGSFMGHLPPLFIHSSGTLNAGS